MQRVSISTGASSRLISSIFRKRLRGSLCEWVYILLSRRLLKVAWTWPHEFNPSGSPQARAAAHPVRAPHPRPLSPKGRGGFWAFATAGKELAALHLGYEKLEPYPLKYIETEGVPLSYRVEDKMRLSKDKTTLRVNPWLTLAGIPPETFQYRLGNRSALEWVLDQYQVSEDKRSGVRSDPNRADDPEYIVRLVGQVIRVSIETARIVAGLPGRNAEG